MRIDCGSPGDTEQVRLARDSLARDGYVVLDRAIDRDAAAALTRAFDLGQTTLDESHRVGERRFVLPLESRDRIARPAIVAVVRDSLGEDAVLDGFAAEVTLPGAGPQHIHRDGNPLFDATLSPLLPAYALIVVLPLGEHRTALWPRSHRWQARDEATPPELVDLPAGSALLRDFRLFHGGTANRSDTTRVVLHVTYARHWYRDPGDVLRGSRTLPPRLLAT